MTHEEAKYDPALISGSRHIPTTLYLTPCAPAMLSLSSLVCHATSCLRASVCVSLFCLLDYSHLLPFPTPFTYLTPTHLSGHLSNVAYLGKFP